MIQAVTDLCAHLMESLDGIPTDTEAVTMLADVRDAVAALKEVDAELVDYLAAIAQGRIVVEGVGTAEVKYGKDRKAWDHEALVRRVVAAGRDERAVDPTTGEVLESEVDAVVRALVACAGIRDWKVTGLRPRGIDPDEYCETNPGRVSIVLTR